MTPFRILFATGMLAGAQFLSVTAAAQAITASETAKIDALVGKALASTGTPSASIAVVRGGRIVLTKAYGKQSAALPVARADVPYQIASISKQFTAAAILLLEDEGKLRLGDTVSKYVPGVSGGDKITIRQLLSHTSGLQDYWPQDYSFEAMRTPTTPRQIVDRWGRKPLDFAPGTQWQYSNTGYVVAGMIVEQAAGEPLLAYLGRKVFKPLGMTPIDQDLARGPGYPDGYQRFALGPVRVEPQAAAGWLFAAGELAMTARDLATWDIARLNRAILPDDDWTTQEAPIKLTDGSNTGYGLGVSIGEAGGRRFVEHSGEAVGFLSENIVYPDDKAAIVVLVNSDFSDAFTTIAQGIAKIVLPPATGDATETAKTAQARALFDRLRTGKIDRSLMTANANYYFTPTALADYRSSLAPLGAPKSFEAKRKPRLRGGFVNRNYKVTYATRTLDIVTYAEPGDHGKYEQFLVMPAN